MLTVSAFVIPGVLIAVEAAKAENDRELLVSLIVVIVFGIVFTGLLLRTKLTVEILSTELRFKFFPLINKWRSIERSAIKQFELRTYKPIAEYGGWGIRGKSKSNKAYNVSGNIGLQLYLNDGRQILFGTQRKKAMEYAMQKMMGENMPETTPLEELKPERLLFGMKFRKFLIIIGIEIVLAILIFVLVQIFK